MRGHKIHIVLLCTLLLSQHRLFAQQSSLTEIEKQANALLKQLTITEKIGMLGYQSKAVPRLKIPSYNWWNEGLHGVARAGKATIFPQAIALASTFNPSLLTEVGDVIASEARAKFDAAFTSSGSNQYMGLTFWSPNINIFRDPRWGRGQETYGEDPFLTAELGKAFVRGLQGTDPSHLKVAAAAKHLAVHSGPENVRHSFNAAIDEKDLRETYLYAFRELAQSGVEAIMCAYNRVNGEPCCSSPFLLDSIVKKEWGFKGHIVADCWALDDIYKGHKTTKGPVETAAAAIKAGVNMDCSDLLQKNTALALNQQLITSADLDRAILPLLRTLLKLGVIGKEGSTLKRNEAFQSEKNRQLARKVAAQSFVLLKNKENILPLKKEDYRSIMVIGPGAASVNTLLGNYHGVSDKLVTPLEGIVGAVSAGTLVQFEQGCTDFDSTSIGGVWAASLCDITIAVIGLNPLLEGEEHDAFLSPASGDRRDLKIPASHIELLKKLHQNGKPLIVVVTGGSAVDVRSILPYADAILLTWYSGEEGGNALADVLFGKTEPGGRLPVTFYRDVTDLPSFDEYDMKNRTYRYFKGPVTFPFGYGLSYTTFTYQHSKQPLTTYYSTDSIQFSIQIKNTGNRSGDEVMQVYIDYPDFERMPLKELRFFKRVHLLPGEITIIPICIPVAQLKKWDLQNHSWNLYQGTYRVMVSSNAEKEQLVYAVDLKK